MGCDIHIYMERRTSSGVWEFVEPVMRCSSCGGHGRKHIANDYYAGGEPDHKFHPMPKGIILPPKPFPVWYIDDDDYGENRERPFTAWLDFLFRNGPPGSVGRLPAMGVGTPNSDPEKPENWKQIVTDWYKMVCPRCRGVGKVIDEPYDGRHYDLFSLLAHCGRGSYEPITGTNRGVPPDASHRYSDLVERYGVDGHSHSWVTLEEVMANGTTLKDWAEDQFFVKYTIPAMETARDEINVSNADVRLVYFFDN